MIDRIRRKGNRSSNEFCSAVDSLQKAGFVTELWQNKKGMLILRWVKKGAQWHAGARRPDDNNIHNQLETIGHNANLWLQARASGRGNEANFAVREV